MYLNNLGSACRFQIIPAGGTNVYRIFDDAYFWVCTTPGQGNFPDVTGTITISQATNNSNQSVANLPSNIINCILQVESQNTGCCSNTMYFRKVPTGAGVDARIYRPNQPTCLLFGCGLYNLGTRFCCVTILLQYREFQSSTMV